MICEPLAYTGPGTSLGPLLTLAIVCVIVGAVVLGISRRRSRTITLALLLLLSGAAMSVTPTSSAHASGVDVPVECATDGKSLTIVQTSVLQGMAPGVAPAPITGIVTNDTDDSTYLSAVTVTIAAVRLAPDAAPGVCDASDYVLLDPVMPVERTIAPGTATSFAGASIGFSNKSTNQDTCKRATVQLLYTAVPR